MIQVANPEFEFEKVGIKFRVSLNTETLKKFMLREHCGFLPGTLPYSQFKYGINCEVTIPQPQGDSDYRETVEVEATYDDDFRRSGYYAVLPGRDEGLMEALYNHLKEYKKGVEGEEKEKVTNFIEKLKKNFRRKRKRDSNILFPPKAKDVLEGWLKEISSQYDSFYENLLAEGIEIRFKQEYSNYDWPTIALDRWEIPYELEGVGEYIRQKYGVSMQRVLKCAKKNGFAEEERRVIHGWSECELTDYTVHVTKELCEKTRLMLSPGEIETLKQQYEKLKEQLKEENLLEGVFVGTVVVDEMGYFSKCPPYCDDCMPCKHITRDYIDDIRDISPTFYVKSRYKTYTYYKPTPEALELLKTKYPEKIEERREEIVNKMNDIRERLEANGVHIDHSHPEQTELKTNSTKQRKRRRRQ